MLPGLVDLADSIGVHEPELVLSHLMRYIEHAGICDDTLQIKVELSLVVLICVAQSDLVFFRRICKPGRVFVEKAAIFGFWLVKSLSVSQDCCFVTNMSTIIVEGQLLVYKIIADLPHKIFYTSAVDFRMPFHIPKSCERFKTIPAFVFVFHPNYKKA